MTRLCIASAVALMTVSAQAAPKAARSKVSESDFCRSLEYVGAAVDEPGHHCWGTSPIMNGKFYLLTTDHKGAYMRGGGLLWESDDGVVFGDVPRIGYRPPGAYLKPVPSTRVGHYYASGTLQRPQVLVQNGRPAYLYLAAGRSITGGDGSLSYVLKANLGN